MHLDAGILIFKKMVQLWSGQLTPAGIVTVIETWYTHISESDTKERFFY